MQPPPASLPESPASQTKHWKAGTLTYSAGGLVILFIWLLLGDFAWSMRDRSVSPMAQWYLRSLDVPNLLFGLLVSSFPAAVALILGPVVSVRSDRYRSKWGRRIPFLLVTTPIGAFGMLGIALTPLTARWVHGHFPEQSEVMISIICFGVFWAAFEFATVAGQAVFGGLINDVVPKPLLGRFYGLFRTVSLIDGIIFNEWIMRHVPTHFTMILGAIAIFYGVAFTWVCLKVREGDYPPPPPEEVQRQPVVQRVKTETVLYFKECFSNSYYLSVFLMLTAGALAFLPVNAFSIPFAHSLGVDMKLYGRCLAIGFSVSLCLTFFQGWLVDLFHPMRMSMVALLCYAAVAVWGATFVRSAETFSIAFVLHSVVSGFYFTSAASLGLRLYPHEKFAQFASAGGIVLSLCAMVLSPLVGFTIDSTGRQFHYTFWGGALLALVALGSAVYTYRRFRKLGGPAHYVPPPV